MQFIIFWNFSMFQYTPDSPQVKQNLISTITNFVCELPHELQNGLRLITLGNQEILEKPQIWVETVSHPEKKLAISVKKYAEADIKVLQSGPILLDFLIPLQLPHPTPNCRCAPRNKCNRNIFKCVGRQPQLLFVIFKGGKQLLTATWRTSYNFKTSYFHIAGWTEYLTE